MVGPAPPETPEETATTHVVQQALPEWTAWSGILMRALARVWVVGLLVVAAVGSGFALNQMYQSEAKLEELKSEPGPDAYAIVAYRRELERQLKAFSNDRTSDSVPMPPPRPRLLEEIDLARERNATMAAPQAGARVRDSIVRAPE